MRIVSISLADLPKTQIPIGIVGENMHTQVRIDCTHAFTSYPNAVPSMAVKSPEGEIYPVIVERDGNTVVWDVLSSDLRKQGNGEIQLTFTTNDVVSKSFIGFTTIVRSIGTPGEAPEPWQSWIDAVEEAAGIMITQQGFIKFEVDENGHLIFSYTEDVPVAEEEG